MLNHITIMGRFTKDPELRRTAAGVAVASFTLACDRDIKNSNNEREADFIDFVAWRQLGEFIARNFHKGSMIVVSGRLQKRSWKDKDGYTRWTTEVVAENAYFADSKKPDNSEMPPADREYEALHGEDAQLPF